MDLQIELSENNAEEFVDALAAYISASRRTGKRASKPAARAAKGGDVDMKAVPAWVEANGVEVTPRGRISGKVIEQYKAGQ